MSKKQMNYDYMYKGKKNGSPMRTGYEKYTPGIVGKIALGITVPSALIALISVLIAAFGMIQAIVVTFFTFIIAFVGSVVIAIDIVRFNRQQKKATDKREGPKEMDIMRIVHLFIGVAAGVIIGYLIWGVKH